MKGQWIGRFTGTNNGIVVLDLDDEDAHYAGHVYAFDQDPSIPTLVATIVTPNKQAMCTLDLDENSIAALRPGTTLLASREELQRDFPDIVFRKI